MLEYLREAIELAAAHPMHAVVTAIVSMLYLNFMFSGPKVY